MRPRAAPPFRTSARPTEILNLSRVRYWGVGNESWGCGGNFTPEEYATEFRRFTAWVPSRCARTWLYRFRPQRRGYRLDPPVLRQTHRTRQRPGPACLYGWAMHYYCGTAGKGDAIDFSEGLDELLGERPPAWNRSSSSNGRPWASRTGKHRVKLIVDEWGAWHRAGNRSPSRLLSSAKPPPCATP